MHAWYPHACARCVVSMLIGCYWCLQSDVVTDPCCQGDDSSLGPVAVHAVHAAHAVADPGDPGVAMYRPKSLRDHQLFHRTREALLQQGQNPSVHGGRRVVSWTRPSFFCLFWGVTISPTFLGAAH